MIKKIFLNETDEIANISKDQIKNTTQTKPTLSSLNQKKFTKRYYCGKNFIF